MSTAMVSFKMPITTFDALRAIIERDAASSKARWEEASKLVVGDPERTRLLAGLQRAQFEREQVCRVLGI